MVSTRTCRVSLVKTRCDVKNNVDKSCILGCGLHEVYSQVDVVRSHIIQVDIVRRVYSARWASQTICCTSLQTQHAELMVVDGGQT